MKTKLFIAIAALLLIGSLAKTNITESSFAVPPRPVIDTSIDKDKSFENSSVFFSPGVQNDTIYAWAINSSSELSILKRTLDVSTLESKAEDIRIRSNISDNNVVFHQVGPGYIGIATLKGGDEHDPQQLHFIVIPASATANMSISEVPITNNTHTDLEYRVDNIKFQNNGFYLLYSEINQSAYSSNILLQGVNATDGSLLFPQAIKIAIGDSAWLHSAIGFTSATNAAGVVVVWKQYNRDPSEHYVWHTIVNISNGKASKRQLLKTDIDFSTKYFPTDIVILSSSYGVIINKLVDRMPEENSTSTLEFVTLKDGIVNTKQLDFDISSRYLIKEFFTAKHANGFGVLAIIQCVLCTEEEVGIPVLSVRNYDIDGSPVDSQKEIARTDGYYKGLFQPFIDANGALWLGYQDGKRWYLGKLLA